MQQHTEYILSVLMKNILQGFLFYRSTVLNVKSKVGSDFH